MTKLLIHIGYPKAGSTFLQAWFGKHPQLRYAHGGLMGFYSVYDIVHQAAAGAPGDIKYYVTSSESLSQPMSDTGDYPIRYGVVNSPPPVTKEQQASACRLLHDLFPQSHILMVTRGFEDLIRSGYSQYVRGGGVLRSPEMLANMERAVSVRQGEQDLEQRQENLMVFDFDYLIRLYRDAFCPENVLVLPYELLRDNQGAFIATLEERLGLTHHPIDIGQLNPSLSPSELYWYPIISRSVSALAQRLGTRGYTKSYRWYVSKTLDNKLWWLVRLLNRIKPGEVTKADFKLEDVLAYCRGRATLLQDDPLYAPYAIDYLWD